MEKSGICILNSAQKKVVNCNYIANFVINYLEKCTNNTILDNAEKNLALSQISVENLGRFTNLDDVVSKCTALGLENLYVVKGNLSSRDTIYSSGIKVSYL